MAKMGDHFRRGKLEVAMSIVEDLQESYCKKTEIRKNLRVAWNALERVNKELTQTVNGTKTEK